MTDVNAITFILEICDILLESFEMPKQRFNCQLRMIEMVDSGFSASCSN